MERVSASAVIERMEQVLGASGTDARSGAHTTSFTDA
jgi:hypothetical protein